jgi:beta-aspartyl-peptidase (threonine type)
MRRPFVLIAGGLLALLTGAVLAFGARVRGDEEEIRRVLSAQVEAWNEGNLDEFVEAYWKSPKLVFQSGADRITGWDNMRERYRKRYQGQGKEMGKLDFRDMDVILLAPDAAFVRGRWRLKLTNGQEPGGLFTVIFRKLPEGWRIVHDHTSG